MPDVDLVRCHRCGRKISQAAPEFTYWEALDDGSGIVCEACIRPAEQAQIDNDDFAAVDDSHVRRAFAAWFRSGGGEVPANYSGVATHGDHAYVVLRNMNGVMAVYRVRNDGMLKRLRRWPAAIEEVVSPSEVEQLGDFSPGD